MKRMFCLLGSLVCFVSCKQIILNLSGGAEASLLLQKVTGHYEGCQTHPTYAGAYVKAIVDISGDEINYTLSTHSSSTCSDTTGPIIYAQKIVKASLNPLDANHLFIDFEIVKIEFKPQLTYYVNQNYCGQTDWVLNQYKDITGFSCPAFLAADPHHTDMRAVGAIDYSSILVVSDDKIKIIAAFGESGDSDNERKLSPSDFVEVTKI